MNQEKRPYITLSWFELEAIASSNRGETTRLQEVLAELKYRRSRKAVDLYNRVAARVAELNQSKPAVFKWPTTAVVADAETALKTSFFDHDDGLLKFMGYAVGQKGAYRSRRRQVLDYVFNERIPRVHSDGYMEEWGKPKSAERLKKLANSLASFARNAKRKRGSDMAHAIMDWEEDLLYLKQAYYDRKFRFEWPPP